MNISKINQSRMVNQWSQIMEDVLGNGLRNNGGMVYPAVNVKENDKAFEIFVAAPGLKKEDFKISVKEKMLTISSESKKEDLTDAGKYTRKEYGFTQFSRSFNLPEIVDLEHIEASYENGELILSLPKKEKQNLVKEIAIN